MSTVATSRHALGWPQGSVRAMLSLLVIFLVCALILLPPRDNQVREIPAYLMYLMFLVLGHYFAARGHQRGQPAAWNQQPLYLPRGCVRLLLLSSLSAACIYRYSTDPAGFEAQWQASVESLQRYPMLPVIVLAGFFTGALLRMVIGQQPSAWFQDIEAWFSLIATLLMAVATMIHLVINPSLADPTPTDPGLTETLHLTFWEGMLSAVVAFYFGERS